MAPLTLSVKKIVTENAESSSDLSQDEKPGQEKTLREDIHSVHPQVSSLEGMDHEDAVSLSNAPGVSEGEAAGCVAPIPPEIETLGKVDQHKDMSSTAVGGSQRIQVSNARVEKGDAISSTEANQSLAADGFQDQAAFNSLNADKNARDLKFSKDVLVEGDESTSKIKRIDQQTRTSPVKLGSISTPALKASCSKAYSMPKSISRFGNDSESPQIGATLLRRESLRSRGSPRKRAHLRDGKSPQKECALKKRDTLQEREILHQFNANVTGQSAATAETRVDKEPKTPCDNLSASSVAEDGERHCGSNLTSNVPPDPTNESRLEVLDVSLHVSDMTLQEVENDSKAREQDSPQKVPYGLTERSSANEHEKQKSIDPSVDPSAVQEASIMNRPTSAAVANEDVQVDAQTDLKSPGKNDVSLRHTRSSARFSDDTSMLKAFVHRAQAKKAQKGFPILSADRDQALRSPRRSPRKIHSTDNDLALSPHKSTAATTRPGTPTRKGLQVDVGDDDSDDLINETTSCRRSTRSRLPAPSKTPTGAPSLIPLRRGDGSDTMVIPKPQAQDVTVITRTNTRRNKGQSKHPSLALQELPVDSPVKASAGRLRQEQEKKVSWAETLALYQDSHMASEEIEEERPRVRRVRGLGSVNGTPSKKTVVTAVSSSLPPNGTPAPKRRGKIR